jgi:hypothetical protein
MNAGDLFKFRGIADIHAWFILSDPSADKETVLIVNFTSWDKFEDQACVVEPGWHDFIVNRTCVPYSRARVVSDAVLESLKIAGRLEIIGTPSPLQVQFIRDAAMQSARIKLEHAQILIDQNLVQD